MFKHESTLWKISLLLCISSVSSGSALAISYQGSGPLAAPQSDANLDTFRFLGSRWSGTATDGFGLTQGDPTTITWSFIPDGTFISGGVGEPASNSDTTQKGTTQAPSFLIGFPSTPMFLSSLYLPVSRRFCHCARKPSTTALAQSTTGTI